MTKKVAKEERVSSIINAAVEEFLEKGYDSASVDGIAKRAGISKGGIYHHFSNKEILLMETNRTLSEPVLEMAHRAYTNESAFNGLRQYIKEYLDYWSNRPKEMSFFFLSMSKALSSEVLIDYYKEYIVQNTNFFKDLFDRAVLKGEIKPVDTEAYAVSLMGALDGIVSYAMVHPEHDIDAMSERIIKVWLTK